VRGAAAALVLLAATLTAQENQESDARLLELALLRARTELEAADSTYARTRLLSARNLVSAAELEARAADRERAVLSVLERWTALSHRASRLRVLSARKARDGEGEVVVRLRVSVATILPPEAAILALPEDVRHRMWVAHDAEALVSIKDEPGASGTAIGMPYEQPLPLRREPSALEFRLLRDVEAIVVSLESGGRREERKIWLEVDATGTVAVRSVPFSQEADLDGEAVYDLTLERFGASDVPLRLEVHGLPPEIAHGFTDGESGARIGQLRFQTGEHQRRVRLALQLPAGDAGAITLDSAYRFYVVASPASTGAPSGKRSAPPSVHAGPMRADAWRRAGAGIAELELVARGVGRAELRAFNLFHELDEGHPLEIEVPVRNGGSRALDRARIQADLPAGWSVIVEPAELLDVPPGGEQPARLTITPPAGAELGDYEVRLRVDGSAGRRRLTSEPTVLRLRLRARRSGATAAMLLGALLAVGAAAVITTRRIAMR
jgi:hypothetical protein